MSIIYKADQLQLSELIKSATQNATYLIPDLQRPYVWSPRQVILLIDSLFKGWPFGTLLLWEIKSDCYQENEGIPHRPFWQIVDRTKENELSLASKMTQPATYHMVLDGQQRVQSLILALGGDSWGFRVYDHEWADDLRDKKMKKNEQHWSLASLCLDLELFMLELKRPENQQLVRKIEVGRILDWTIPDTPRAMSENKRPEGYGHPLKLTKEYPGRFIRLSRLWDIAQNNLEPDEYCKILTPMLVEHQVANLAEVIPHLASFMRIIERVKNNCYVHALKIASFTLTTQWTKDDYNDAIVNIFTRLNTAGRTLTREEITLAWLKIGWVPNKNDTSTAGECFESFRAELEDIGLNISMDELVRLISFVWSVDNREGKLLESKDLLDGNLIRSMAGAISEKWPTLKKYLHQAASILKERELLPNQASFNSVIVFMAWYYYSRLLIASISGNVAQKDSVDKQLSVIVADFADRWSFLTQWSGVWSSDTFVTLGKYAKNIHEMKAMVGLQQSLEPIKNCVASILKTILQLSEDAVSRLGVRKRNKVSEYSKYLWVWHRLDSVRWAESAIVLRNGKAKTSKLEVDHTVADKWWQRLVDDEIAKLLSLFKGTDEERLSLAPAVFSDEDEARSFINSIGNCSLLEKSFNVSKSDKTLWSFIKQVHEFQIGKDRGNWENALALTPVLTDPVNSTISDIFTAINEREKIIKDDLTGFIRGQIKRQDI